MCSTIKIVLTESSPGWSRLVSSSLSQFRAIFRCPLRVSMLLTVTAGAAAGAARPDRHKSGLSVGCSRNRQPLPAAKLTELEILVVANRVSPAPASLPVIPVHVYAHLA